MSTDSGGRRAAALPRPRPVWTLLLMVWGVLLTPGSAEAALGASRGVQWWLWGSAALLLMLLTIVLVLIVTREMTPGRLIGVGLAMALVLTVSVLEERDGLISRFATNLTSDRVVTEQFSDRRPNRRSPPPPEESQSSTSSTETLRESQEIFRREARRRRRRRRREALRKHLLSDNASDPESPSSDSSRVLARTSAEGDARTQPMQFQTEWVLGWETPQKTDELVLDVVRDGHVVRTLETPPEATRGTSDPFPPGEYAVRVHSSGKWTLLLMKADSRG